MPVTHLAAPSPARPRRRSFLWTVVVLALLTPLAWLVNLPYFAASAGPTGDAVDAVIVEEDFPVFQPEGELILLTVSLQPVNLYEAAIAFFDQKIDLIDRELLRPRGETDEEARQRGLRAMDRSKDIAIAVALAELGLEEALAEAAAAYRGRVAFAPAYDEALSHRMYAGGDVLLMPSRYEPSGLNQLYAMRYGALPYVRRVGGLADSVSSSPTPEPDVDTGFHFDAFAPADFLAGMKGICRVFLDQGLWRMMMRNAMDKNSGWDGVAPRYVDLYEKAMRPQPR